MSEYTTPAETVKARAIEMFLTAIKAGDKKLGAKLEENIDTIRSRVLYHIQRIGVTDYAATVLGSKKRSQELLALFEQAKTIICDDCDNKFKPEHGRYYKYEAGIWLCYDCHDRRMEEDEW